MAVELKDLYGNKTSVRSEAAYKKLFSKKNRVDSYGRERRICQISLWR